MHRLPTRTADWPRNAPHKDVSRSRTQGTFLPDSTRHQAGPVAPPLTATFREASAVRAHPPSGLFGGRGTAFVVLARSLAIAIRVDPLSGIPDFAGALSGTGAMFLAPAPSSSACCSSRWLDSHFRRLRAEALALEMTRACRKARRASGAFHCPPTGTGAGRKLPVPDRSGGGRGWSNRRSAIPLARPAGSCPAPI